MRTGSPALFALALLLPAAGHWAGSATGAAAPAPPSGSLSTSSAPSRPARPKPAPIPAPPESDQFAAIHANSTGQPWKR